MRGSTIDLPTTVDEEELAIRETDWGSIHVNLVTCHKTLDMAPLLKGLPSDTCRYLLPNEFPVAIARVLEFRASLRPSRKV